MKVSVQRIAIRGTAGGSVHGAGLLTAVAGLVLAFSACGSDDPAAPSGAAGGMAVSAAGTGATPTAGTGATPTAGTGATPTAGTGAIPTAGTGATPTAGTGATPTAGTGATPTAGTGATAGATASAGTSAAGAPATAGSGAAGGAAPSGAATFTAVLAIFADSKNNCGLCHGMMSIGGGLLFKPTDKAMTYAALVGPVSKGTDGSQCSGKTYVVPGKPDDSLLYDKLSKATPTCGARMPANGVVLSDAELATIRAWITAGAMNN